MTYTRLLLDQPHLFLGWLAAAREKHCASLDEIDVAQVYALAAIATLARCDGKEFLHLEPGMHSGAAKFAHALGIEEVVAGNAAREPRERDRTVTLTRVSTRGETETTATKIVRLLFPSVVQPEAAKLLWFVLVELLRNVVQHSQDPAGGIVAAQCNDVGPYESDPTIQIVVADNGVGIFEALRRARSTIQSPEAALLRALEPHVSGTFVEGGSGTVENAGLGLFFVSEMAKRTKGRLLLASRGASYYLDRYGVENTQPKTTGIGQPDFPGTLVAFEIPLSQVRSYDEVISEIHQHAAQWTPKRVTHHWLRFEDAPEGTARQVVTVAAEDTVAAHRFAAQVLEPKLLRREVVALDFQNLRVCTQSFLHALLHQSVRLAWALKVPMYVANVTPALRAQLELVESYSLGG